MINKTEYKIFELLLSNLTLELSISDIAKLTKKKFPQIHRIVSILAKKGLVNIKSAGKSKIIKLDFLRYHREYIQAEMERNSVFLEKHEINSIHKIISQIDKQFICLLFGSTLDNKKSDIDLLFIISNDTEAGKFERTIKNQLSLYNVDINVINEKSLFEMWAQPQKFNLGNEILKKHVVLSGAERFINLLKQQYGN